LAPRVLIVDDNTDSADSLALLLSMTGHHVRTAYDGRGALRHAVDGYRPAGYERL
jgi:DNA-binding response OmpR family regulator